MALTEQGKEHKNSTAESFASLSIGLWTVSLIGYSTSGISWGTYFLVILGAISALLSIYLIVPKIPGKESVLECLETNKIIRFIKPFIWLIVLAVFGVRLVQTKVIWLIFTGLITIVMALIVFYVSLWKTGKDYRKEKETEVKTMGSKGRKNVKKPKKGQEKKPQQEEKKK